MENETINIATIKVLDGQENKKIKVKLDLFNEVLFFEGHCKIKANGTTNWRLVAIENYDVKDYKGDMNFENIAKSLHDEMIRKIELISLVEAFMHEVTEIEIKGD